MKKMILALAVLLAVGCEKEVINQTKTNSMAKILDAYGGNITAAMIKANADIPTQGNMVINGTTVECTNLDSDQIAAVLGESDSSVAGLCTSPNVNKWSRFSPIEFYNESGALATRVGLPYMLDIFAGYNHNAIMPYMEPVSETSLGSSNGGINYQMPIKINLGEVNWSKWGYDYCYILVDGVVNTSFPLTQYTENTLKEVLITLTAPNVGLTRTYSVTIWMGNDIQKTSNLTQVSGSFSISVKNPPVFASHTVVNSPANRLVIEDYMSINKSTEYISDIYLQPYDLAISFNALTGKYLLTADVKRKSDNVYLRTITIGGGSSLERPLCDVKMYKSNNNVTSATYTVNSNYQIGTASGGYAYSFTIPTDINKVDGDNFYLVFDRFH